MKLRKLIRLQFAIVAVIVGLGITFIVNASRNSSGTYSLPAGNPVVSGTTINSTVHNNTMSDLATEVTDSLSRSNKGAMLGNLELVAGADTAASPALTWDGDEDMGLYRIGADNFGFATGGTKRGELASTGFTFQYGLTVTEADSNSNAVTATGSGTGSGLHGTGGATNGDGVTGVGVGTGPGLRGTGASGTAGRGVIGIGGSGGGTGARFSNGVNSTASDPTVAVLLDNGMLAFTGTADPNSDEGFTDTLTPMNVPKAWVMVTSGTPTVNAGFNIASVTEPGSNALQINIANDMGGTSYAPICNVNGGSTRYIIQASNLNAGFFWVQVWNNADTAVDLATTASIVIYCVVFGDQ